MVCILTRHVTHWACLGCSGSTCTTRFFQFPPTSHWSKKWANIPLYVKGMCHTAGDKWWSHQIPTGFLIHTRYRLVFWSTSLPFFLNVSVNCIPISCEIHRLGSHYSLLYFNWLISSCDLELGNICETVAFCPVYIWCLLHLSHHADGLI